MAIPTGTPTTTSSISNLVQAAYDQYVRMALRSIPVMRSLADVKPVQQAMPGSSVVFSIYSDLTQATSTLTMMLTHPLHKSKQRRSCTNHAKDLTYW